MCNIGGFIASPALDPVDARRLLAAIVYYGMNRGRQSAGVYANGKLFKKAIDATDFISHDEFHHMFDDMEPVAMGLAHNRQPTCGGRGDEQAQPFVNGTTASVHNGMYWDTTALKKKFNIKKPSGVDSELVTSYVAEYGIKSLPKFIKESDGPSGIAVIQDDHLYLMREGNPTHYVTLNFPDGANVLAFSSQATDLLRALGHVWLLPRDLKAYETKEGILFEATPTGIIQLSEKKVFAKVASSYRGGTAYHNHTGRGYSGHTYNGNGTYTPSADLAPVRSAFADWDREKETWNGYMDRKYGSDPNGAFVKCTDGSWRMRDSVQRLGLVVATKEEADANKSE